MRLKNTLELLEYLLSPRSLRLHEEYQSRIQVLRQLGYIDSDNLGIKNYYNILFSHCYINLCFFLILVQMKGRVACEMGNQNELMVTEMVCKF